MSENIETLQQSLEQYELQLLQVREAIARESSEELHSLQENLVELITLTKENLNSLKTDSDEDPLCEEYRLFKAELGDTTAEFCNDNEQSENSIEDELNRLIGSKCQAPFCEQWSENNTFTYHNALVMSIDSVDSLNNINVKVMFVNPTCKEMLPCQYYLSGECKFSDDQCHYSHGYIVNFSKLREYREPDFNLLKENTSVLAKDIDNLWKRAIVTALIQEEHQCSVKFESGKKQEILVDIQNTLPLTELDEVSSNEIENINEVKSEELYVKNRHEMLVEKSLLQQPSAIKFGEWEKYTKNIGSKLMANMGYVVGTGLGKHGEGRIEPVTAVVLPPRKSLDHCMALREAAGGDSNFFSADKLQKKFGNHVIVKKRKATKKKSDDIFSFINKSLSNNDSSSNLCVSHGDGNDFLKQSSSQALNVEELKISQNIEKKNFELIILRDKLSRHKTNTVGHNTLKNKIKRAENELHAMRSKLTDVYKEKSYRQTMKELTEF